MVKKIGFIDYFLDEWHANKYPTWIESASGGMMKVTCAYGMIDSPHGRSNAQWCEDHGIELHSSIEEVIQESDYLIILSPDHPEYHEELAQLPLRSGKPTYMDKTFAPDRGTAIALFNTAREYNTPLYSSSALRFASEYTEIERKGIETICSVGSGSFNNYSIHQIEPIVSLMGTEATRVMFIGTANSPAMIIEFSNGRQATINHFGPECPFTLTMNYDSGEARVAKPESDFFGSFIARMLAFFENGEPAVDPAETIAIITIIEHGLKAMHTPYQWIELPS
ncbi:hypothetical protein ACK8P5_17020 [Paenibacillus sp. EC2-1]|uniref:hypothetical protein n=1 Tax=Paenibacillus sp. EC2-1 TaxID=3388665 RepID=UPI003BEF0E84